MNNKEKWNNGLRKEVVFWDGWIKTAAHKYNIDRPVIPYFRNFITGSPDEKILDVGCGAVGCGTMFNGIKMNITGADYLADEYHKSFNSIGMAPIFKIEKQDMACMTYPDNTFDFVHCRNALDHCYDPYNSIKEMIRVCKPRGWVHLVHFVNVAKTSFYGGLHVWNICKSSRSKNPDCLFWNRNSEITFLLSEIDKGFTNRGSNGDPDYNTGGLIIISTLKKK